MRRLLPALLCISAAATQLDAVEAVEISEFREYIAETDYDTFNKWTGNIFGVFGVRNLRGSDFDPVEDQTNTGIMFDFGKDEWPMHICLEYFNSSDEESQGTTDYELSVSEMNIGLRYIIDVPNRPITIQAGGGISFIDIELETSTPSLTVSDDESTHGYWYAAGAYYRWQDRFLIGFDIHYTDARSSVGGTGSVNSGGWQSNIIAGFRF